MGKWIGLKTLQNGEYRIMDRNGASSMAKTNREYRKISKTVEQRKMCKQNRDKRRNGVKKN